MKINSLYNSIKTNDHVWLITGVAGFIGSNLLEILLKLNQRVVGIDNFSTGFESNLLDVKKHLSDKQWTNFQFIKGDILERSTLKKIAIPIDFILHQAALGSVPRSLENPIDTNLHNINGFLNLIEFARLNDVKRFVYASSSSVYGDSPLLPKIESVLGNLLSPYALTKRTNELYAQVYQKCYGLESVGLRYFNVFGRRQNPEGYYSAVIPKWIGQVIRGETITINGNGSTSRDFCYIDNVVQANILACFCEIKEDTEKNIYNVCVGERTTLNQLFEKIKSLAKQHGIIKEDISPYYADFRKGDVLHSHGDMSLIEKNLGYSPSHKINEGLEECFEWYTLNFNKVND